MICSRCGREIPDDSNVCGYCGLQLKAPIVPVNVDKVAHKQALEQEFLDNTYRLLRWEKKAWSICGKFLVIFGSIFAAYFMLFALIFGFVGLMGALATEGAEAILIFTVVYLTYAVLLGGAFIGCGIVCLKARNKVDQYIDSVYTDFSLANTRCRSIGMLVFAAIFGDVAAVFFVINFVRMRAHRAVVDEIIAKQAQAREQFADTLIEEYAAEPPVM